MTWDPVVASDRGLLTCGKYKCAHYLTWQGFIEPLIYFLLIHYMIEISFPPLWSTGGIVVQTTLLTGYAWLTELVI